MILVLQALQGCDGPDVVPSDGTTAPSGATGDSGATSTTGDTGPSTPTAFPASCRLDPNPLRATCTATLTEPGPVRVELVGAASDPVRVFTDEASTVEHSVLAWGLAPFTAYSWRIVDERTGEEVTGTLHTGSAAFDLADLDLSVSAPDPFAVDLDAVVFQASCPSRHLVMVDRLGRVIWYQGVDGVVEGSLPVNAMTFTEDQTFLVELGKTTVIEFDLGGRLLMRSDRGADFENLVHHELYKKDGLVYVIYATVQNVDGVDVIVDGVYVLDAQGDQLGEISTLGLYPYGAVSAWMIGGYWGGFFPDAVDFSHGNAVFVDDAGDIWVSFRHLHAVAKFRGGPGSTGFGELLWTAVGHDSSVIWDLSDFTVDGSADPWFSGQHDVHLADDGMVLMIDNGLGAPGTSRGVRYAIDEGARTLTELDAWDLGLVCPIQGAVREIDGGDVVITCASAGLVQEFAPGADTPDWSLSARCMDLFPTPIVRGIPVDL